MTLFFCGVMKGGMVFSQFWSGNCYKSTLKKSFQRVTSFIILFSYPKKTVGFPCKFPISAAHEFLCSPLKKGAKNEEHGDAGNDQGAKPRPISERLRFSELLLGPTHIEPQVLQ